MGQAISKTETKLSKRASGSQPRDTETNSNSEQPQHFAVRSIDRSHLLVGMVPCYPVCHLLPALFYGALLLLRPPLYLQRYRDGCVSPPALVRLLVPPDREPLGCLHGRCMTRQPVLSFHSAVVSRLVFGESTTAVGNLVGGRGGAWQTL